MSQIRTESITGLNNLSTNNIDLSDDGTTTFNGPVVADRVKSGSSNLQYDYRTRTTATIIPVPSWATDIEIDFYAFRSTASVSQYTTITPFLANSTSNQITTDFKLNYANIPTNLGYGAINEAGGNWGSLAGSTSTQILYLLLNSPSIQWSYSGTIRFKKVPFTNGPSGVTSTNNIYYITLNCLYRGSNNTGVINCSGFMYGPGDDPDDVISEIAFGTNGTNQSHQASFNVQFREEDPGTLITT